MKSNLKQWSKLLSDNQRLYNRIIPAIRKQVLKNSPETTIVLQGDKQIGKNLFTFEIIITLDMEEQLVDESNNGWSVNHEVVSIDFVKFGIFNEHNAQTLTDTQERLLRNSVDTYLRNIYTI